MGAHVDYSCPACGLTGHVSGGEDCGMDTLTTTIYCKTCDQLQDVPVGVVPYALPEHHIEPRCRRRKSHRFQIWNREEPCPRCGKALLEMDENGNITMWD